MFNLNNHQPKNISFELNKKEDNHPLAQEKRIAKKIGGNRSKGSGGSTCKSDCFSKVVRIECKTTSKESIRLDKDWLIKIKKEASETNREPCLAIQFDDLRTKWIAIEEDFFMKLLNNFKG